MIDSADLTNPDCRGGMMLAKRSDIPRSWQLLMVGPGSCHVTPDLHDRLMRLFDLLPQTRLIEIVTDAGNASISRDSPSNRMEEVSGIEADIAAMPGIISITLFQAAS